MTQPSTRARLPGLSKSRFCAGLQCEKQLWWRVHEPEAPATQQPAAQCWPLPQAVSSTQVGAPTPQAWLITMLCDNALCRASSTSTSQSAPTPVFTP